MQQKMTMKQLHCKKDSFVSRVCDKNIIYIIISHLINGKFNYHVISVNY